MLKFLIAPSLGKKLSEKKAQRLEKILKSLFGEFSVRVANDYVSLEEELITGDADFAWAPPQIGGDLANNSFSRFLNIQRLGSIDYRAAMICRKSEEKSMREFASLRGAWVSPESTAGYQLPKQWFASQDICINTDLAESVFLGSYEAVLEAVKERRADIGAVFASSANITNIKTALDLYPHFKKEMTIFAFTSDTPNDAIFVSKSCPEKSQLDFKNIFTDRSSNLMNELLKIFDAEAFLPF